MTPGVTHTQVRQARKVRCLRNVCCMGLHEYAQAPMTAGVIVQQRCPVATCLNGVSLAIALGAVQSSVMQQAVFRVI